MEKSSLHLPLRTIFFLLLLSQFTLGCRPKVEFSTQSYIIGGDDIELLGEDKKPTNHEPPPQPGDPGPMGSALSLPLVVLQVGSDTYKFCSGLLMPPEADAKAERRIVTNYHCFAPQEKQEDQGQSPGSPTCTNTKAVFGFQYRKQEEASIYPCLPESFRFDETLDLATFKIADPESDLSIGVELSEFLPEEMLGRKAWIVHYPNLPQNLVPSTHFHQNLPLAAKTDTNCEVQQVFSHSFKEAILHYGIGHNCDLTHGSSGSALVDQDSGKVLGINWGGIIYEQNDQKTTINVATSAIYVHQFLSGDTSIAALAPPNSSSEIEPQQTAKAASTKKRNPNQCGVVGSSTADRKNATGMTMTLSLLAVPLLLCLLLCRFQSLWISLAILGGLLDSVTLANPNMDRQAVTTPDEQKVLQDASWLWFLGQTLSTSFSQGLALSQLDTLTKGQVSSADQELITWLVVLEVLQPQYKNIWVYPQTSANEMLQLSNAESFKELKALRGKLAQGHLELESFVALALGTIPNVKIEATLIKALMSTRKLSCLPPQLNLGTPICDFWDHLSTMERNPDKLSRFPALSTYLALAQEFQQERFPTVLRQLYHLQKTQDLAAIPYRIVQRIYARQQKGSGKVALDHL